MPPPDNADSPAPDRREGRRRPSTRVPELDALRGGGALAILAFHIWPGTFFFGWSRVELFFVISGYLITTIILKYGDSSGFMARFYARRALRTWPAYFLLMAVASALNAGAPPGARLRDLAYHLTFCQNVPYYRSATPPDFNPALVHTWCLAVEEQFYLLWPPLLWAFRGRKLGPFLALVVTNAVILRGSGLHPWTLAARCDGLAIGSALAVLLRDGDWVRARLGALRRAFTLLTAAAALGVVALYSPLASAVSPTQTFSQPIGFAGSLLILAVNLFYAGVVALVVCHSGRPGLRPLRARAIRYLGQSSYGLFLFHFEVIRRFHVYYNHEGLPPAVGVAVGALCVALGALSWEYLEKPLAGLKQHLPYRAPGRTEDPADGSTADPMRNEPNAGGTA